MTYIGAQKKGRGRGIDETEIRKSLTDYVEENLIKGKSGNED